MEISGPEPEFITLPVDFKRFAEGAGGAWPHADQFWRVSMQPKTEGSEEKGPSNIPFINDPQKPTSPPMNDADATDAAEAEEDIQDDAESI